MLALAQSSLPVLAVALVIGIITGRWTFARRAVSPIEAEESNPS
jgi:hypothetical protein